VALTGRGVALSVGAVVLFLAGELAGYAVFRVLGGALAFVVLAAVASVARRDAVAVTCSARPERPRRGDTVRLHVTVHAERSFAGGATVFPPGQDTKPLPLPEIAAGGTVGLDLAVVARRRGRMRVGPVAVERLGLCGLARRVTPVEHTPDVLVRPRVWPAGVTGAGGRHAPDGAVVPTVRRGSVEPVGIREYAPGDPWRQVHWRATARTGRLLVRELVDPRELSFTVLLDTRPSRLAASAFEEAVDLAASLLAAHPGPATLRTTDGLSASRAPDLLLDLLADVTQTDREPGLVRGGGRLVLVTGGLTDADVAAVRRFGDVVCVDFGTGVRPPGMRVLRATDAETAARTWPAVVR
jgi:uncharacterized protein (DUF58 family)